METPIYESQRDIESSVTHILLHNEKVYQHFHNSLEIFYVEKGTVAIQALGIDCTLSEGEAFFIPPFLSHRFASIGQTTTQSVIISPRYLEHFKRSHENLAATLLLDKEFNKKIVAMFDEINRITKAENIDHYYLHGACDYLLGCIVDHYKPAHCEKTGILVVQIAEFIKQNYQRKISLEEIGSYFGYNSVYFSKLFKRAFNCSFVDYVNLVRYNHVQNAPNNQPLADIIYEAGFNSPSSYYRVKKKIEEGY